MGSVLLPRPPPRATLWSPWGAWPKASPPTSEPSAQTLDFKQNHSLFRVWAKILSFFFQIVWAWQVPNDTVPKAPSSYNLKEKKKQDTKPRRVSRESGPRAAASAASSKSQCAASQSGPNGLTEACPAFCNFLFCFIFNLSMRCCLPRELGAGQAAGGQVSPAKNPLPQAARCQGRYPGAVGTVGTACEGAGVGAAVPALLVHLRGQGPSHASRAPPRARTDTDWPHPRRAHRASMGSAQEGRGCSTWWGGGGEGLGVTADSGHLSHPWG